MLCVPKVLLLTGDEKEANHLRDILGNQAFLTHATDMSGVKMRLEEDSRDVLLCSWAFYQRFWDGELLEIRRRYPDLPMVILSRSGGEREWLEVLEAGAFDLLSFPCQKTTLLGLVEQAMVSQEARKARRFTGLV